MKVRESPAGCCRGQGEAGEAGQHDLLVGGARGRRGTHTDQGLRRIQGPGTTTGFEIDFLILLKGCISISTV